VHLSLREKRNFYLNLAQLMRSGIPMAAAMEKLAATSRGASLRVVRKLREALGAGHSMGDAFAHLQPALGEMECAAISALERTGRLDRGLQQLSEYFESMENARKEMLRKSAYPFFLLHFGIVAIGVVNAVKLMPDQHAVAVSFLHHCAWAFGALYGLAAILWFFLPKLADAGARSVAVDWTLQQIFFLGKIRRAFALARFCATYDMQLDAGVNVIDSLLAAGRASRSGRIARAVEQTIAQVRQGGQVGSTLTRGGVFPNSFTQTFLVAEETGELDRALARLATEYRNEAVTRLSTFSEWLPKLLYVSVLLYFGWSIIQFYRGYFADIERQIGSM
jgi:type IV pilus assembly protein PilC